MRRARKRRAKLAEEQAKRAKEQNERNEIARQVDLEIKRAECNEKARQAELERKAVERAKWWGWAGWPWWVGWARCNEKGRLWTGHQMMRDPEIVAYCRSVERKYDEAKREDESRRAKQEDESRRARQGNEQMTATFLIRKAELEKASRQLDECRWIGQLKNRKLPTPVREDPRDNSVSTRLQIGSGNSTSLERLAPPPGKRYSTQSTKGNRVL